MRITKQEKVKEYLKKGFKTIVKLKHRKDGNSKRDFRKVKNL
jgi:hypothetical protein